MISIDHHLSILTHTHSQYYRLPYLVIHNYYAGDDNSCGVTLINEGVEVMGDCVRIQFTGCGAVQSFRCKLNKEPFKFCEFACMDGYCRA